MVFNAYTKRIIYLSTQGILKEKSSRRLLRLCSCDPAHPFLTQDAVARFLQTLDMGRLFVPTTGICVFRSASRRLPGFWGGRGSLQAEHGRGLGLRPTPRLDRHVHLHPTSFLISPPLSQSSSLSNDRATYSAGRVERTVT